MASASHLDDTKVPSDTQGRIGGAFTNRRNHHSQYSRVVRDQLRALRRRGMDGLYRFGYTRPRPVDIGDGGGPEPAGEVAGGEIGVVGGGGEIPGTLRNVCNDATLGAVEAVLGAPPVAAPPAVAVVGVAPPRAGEAPGQGLTARPVLVLWV